MVFIHTKSSYSPLCHTLFQRNPPSPNIFSTILTSLTYFRKQLRVQTAEFRQLLIFHISSTIFQDLQNEWKSNFNISILLKPFPSSIPWTPPPLNSSFNCGDTVTLEKLTYNPITRNLFAIDASNAMHVRGMLSSKLTYASPPLPLPHWLVYKDVDPT